MYPFHEYLAVMNHYYSLDLEHINTPSIIIVATTVMGCSLVDHLITIIPCNQTSREEKGQKWSSNPQISTLEGLVECRIC